MSFRREAHVPKGGPDGGDGGRGGDVVLRCDDSLRDLQRFRRSSHFSAGRGGHGQGSLRHGADGDPLVITVPPGTAATVDNGTRHDLTTPGQQATIVRGGSGGRGNKRFAGPTRQAPRLAERGLSGEEATVELQLKLLADVGLVGLPNAGKCSLLARLTRATPKVASYPFTTLEPVLGTIELDDRQLVIADIPGLIEGASDGAGLGHDFLAHIERTRLLVHVLDLAPLDGSDPVDNHATIEAELAAHDPRLAALPRILVLAKADLVDPAFAEEAAEVWRARIAAEEPPREEWDAEAPVATPVIVTSSATGEGLDALVRELGRRVPLADAAVGRAQLAEVEAGVEALAEHRTFRPATGAWLHVEKLGEGSFRVAGKGMEQLIARHDLENEEALAHIEHTLRKCRRHPPRSRNEGFEAGDDVEIGGVVFELQP